MNCLFFNRYVEDREEISKSIHKMSQQLWRSLFIFHIAEKVIPLLLFYLNASDLTSVSVAAGHNFVFSETLRQTALVLKLEVNVTCILTV